MSLWIGARELVISWGDNSSYWKWTTFPESKAEIAQLINVHWLDIRGQVDSNRLPLKTSYAAFLVFKLADTTSFLEKVTARVRFNNEIADGTDNEGFTIFLVKKQSAPGERGVFPQRRSDGWMEIKLGLFFNNLGEDGAVDMRLFEIDDNTAKSGLFVKGVELRPY